MPPQAHVVLPLALLVLGFDPTAPFRARVDGKLERLSDSGPRGVVTLACGELEAALEVASGSVVLRGLPVPGGIEADLELRPVSALEPGACALVVNADGSTSSLPARVRCFAGRVVGGGAAFLGVSAGRVNGYVTLGEDLYYLSPGERGQLTLAHSSRTGDVQPPLCDVVGPAPDPRPGGIERLTTTPSLRTADIFVEADNKYRARFASDQECIDYTVLLFTAASEIYRRDIGVKLNIPGGYLRVWNTTPPWGVITGLSSLKNIFNWWLGTKNPLRDLPRAAVHVLSNPNFGGTSRGTDQLCDNNGSYELSGVSGRFPYPVLHTDRGNWDLFVVCHELGHTFGSPHSSQYSPPIECEDGSGPDSGTLMSYCHIEYGVARVGMRFHLREQQKIQKSIEDARCLRSRLLLRGDYDGDGALDVADLLAAEVVAAQGFRSLAAEELFDLDADGDMDGRDHDLLAELVYGAPPASMAVRNGTGVNPLALSARGSPLLGTTWPVQVLASGTTSSSLLVGYDLPHSGITTVRGELLVSTAPFGGTKLYSSTADSNGTLALHAVALPLDPSLFGLAVSFQALVLGSPEGDHYTNALDAVLSPWE